VRWYDDKRFVAWLVEMEYVYREGTKLKHHFSGDGIVLYMYEAWTAGRAARQKSAK
jgi:hypothetical protein